MARNDGVDRTCARNMDVTDNDIGDAQAHNEREKKYTVTKILSRKEVPSTYTSKNLPGATLKCLSR